MRASNSAALNGAGRATAVGLDDDDDFDDEEEHAPSSAETITTAAATRTGVCTREV